MPSSRRECDSPPLLRALASIDETQSSKLRVAVATPAEGALSPSANGEATGFSIQECGFDSRWGHRASPSSKRVPRHPRDSRCRPPASTPCPGGTGHVTTNQVVEVRLLAGGLFFSWV